MTKKTFKIEYDYTTLAEVQVDEEQAAPFIRAMVDFWSDSEDCLKENDNNYLHTWLKQLGSFILRRRRPPQDDEGWYNLDGSSGLKLVHREEYEFDAEQIEIEEVKQ